MALIEINWNPSRRELRQFGTIWLPAFLALVGAWLYFRIGATTAATILWLVALAVELLGWLKPEWLRRPFVGWMCAAFPIGWVVSHTLLAIVFYLVLTPIGLVLRLFGHDPMKKRFDRSATTYWVPHRKRPDVGHYFRQF